MTYTLLFINIILLVLGQSLWKVGLSNKELSFSFKALIGLIFNPYIFIGLLIYMGATFIWFYILSKAKLSLVYPLQSLCYVLAAVVGVLFFKEQIPFTRWIGIGLIVLGAFFVSLKG